jgi:hypothetical protein
MQPKEWIDRYVSEVGRRLPGKQRADVEQEMRSLIEDELDGLGHAPTESDVLAVLTKFGAPEEIAVRYGATNYLIGPVLLPVFRIVVGIVLTIQTAVILFALAVGVGLNSEVFSPLDALGGLTSGLLQTFGMIVLIFALVERFGGVQSPEAAPAWNPRTLPAVDDYDRVKVGDTIASMVALAVLIVLLNTFARWTGPVVVGEMTVIQLMSPVWWSYVPWLSFVWVAELVLNAVVLLRGRWSLVTRGVSIALEVAGLAILLHMLTNPAPLLAFAPADPGLRVGIAVIVTFVVIGIAQQVYRLFRAFQGRRAVLV